MTSYDQSQVVRALTAVGQLNATELDQRIEAEMGDQVLAALSALAQSQQKGPNPSGDPTRTVHLMVLAYLIRGELERSAAK